jgi:hypothetical protein
VTAGDRESLWAMQMLVLSSLSHRSDLQFVIQKEMAL